MSNRTAHIVGWLIAFATCAVALTILELADYSFWALIPVAFLMCPILAFEIWHRRRFPKLKK